MRRNPALYAGVLAIAMCAAASAQTYHALIATEDGAPLPTTPQVIPVLSTALVQECIIVNIFGSGNVLYVVNWRSRPYDPSTADACDVTIRLKGYRAVTVTLRNDSTVVLKRIGLHEGSTVSATSLQASPQAKKEYGKGVNSLTDEKWASAQKHLEKAVEIDPQYAAAWSDLGEALLRQSKPDDARAAWEKAVAADPKYIRPYVQLAGLDLTQKRNEDAAAIAGRAVAMNPLEFPQLYFYFAVANFNLKHYEVAEKNAKRAIDVDTDHEVPRAQVLLATLLAARGDRSGALEHFKKYIELAPKAPDAAQIQRAIAELETPGATQK